MDLSHPNVLAAPVKGPQEPPKGLDASLPEAPRQDRADLPDVPPTISKRLQEALQQFQIEVANEMRYVGVSEQVAIKTVSRDWKREYPNEWAALVEAKKVLCAT